MDDIFSYLLAKKKGGGGGGGFTPQEIAFTKDDISAGLGYNFSIKGSSGTDVTGTLSNPDIERRYPGNQTSGWRGGRSHDTAYQIFDASTQSQIDAVLKHLAFITDTNIFGANYQNAPSMTVNGFVCDHVVKLPNIAGKYSVNLDFYIGFVCQYTYLRVGSAYQGSRTITTSASELDYEEASYVDRKSHRYTVVAVPGETFTVDATAGGVTNIMTYNRLHLQAKFEDIVVTTGNNVVNFDLGDYLNNHVGNLVGSGVYGNGWENKSPYFLSAFFELSGTYNGPNQE